MRDRPLGDGGNRHAQDAADLPQSLGGRWRVHDVAGGELAGEQRGKRAEGKHVRAGCQRGQRRLRGDAVAQFSVEVVLDYHGAGARGPLKQLHAAGGGHCAAERVKVRRGHQQSVEAVWESIYHDAVRVRGAFHDLVASERDHATQPRVPGVFHAHAQVWTKRKENAHESLTGAARDHDLVR